MTVPNDTTPEAEEVQLELLRRKSPRERLELAMRLSTAWMRRSKEVIRNLHPEYTEPEVGEMFVEIHYGKELAEGLRECRRSRTRG
jgi:hypothetical protein